jgi:thymidylate synthase (FAD)
MPKVTLISWPTNPLKAIVAAVENMSGNMIHDMDEITDEQIREIVHQLNKTKINGAFEFGGDYVFQIEGVPRAFTHQAVRKRVGATYSQESMRFASKYGEQFDYDTGPSIKGDPLREKVYDAIMDEISKAYDKLIDEGAETQDARGALPINTLTKIGVRFNLMTLMHIADVRLCYQSQGHWVNIVKQMKQEIAEKVSPIVAGLLVKACDRTGKCEFKAIFDRDCPVEKTLIKNVCASCTKQKMCKPERYGYCAAIKKFMLKQDIMLGKKVVVIDPFRENNSHPDWYHEADWDDAKDMLGATGEVVDESMDEDDTPLYRVLFTDGDSGEFYEFELKEVLGDG